MVKTAVIGAGPAGLTFVLAACRRGEKDITVYEREDDHFARSTYNPDRSYTIDITGKGKAALDYVDACEAFQESLLEFNGIRILAPKIMAKDSPYHGRGWTGSRGDICRTLQQEIVKKHPGAVKFVWNATVTVRDVYGGKLVIETDSQGCVWREACDRD
eukprot:TRINITY_DN73178_c0_g1_i1.p1 TRINITY_DN73178_c0_g1~~TRINITY_DN73178_c0_g1_i1.p1  ORF type:complete len:159 (-),score=16.14 TRINITY_DN73178_c0_g1_i1:21-497(-)